MEFALIASFLILLLLVTFDYGRIFFTAMGVTAAANSLALFTYNNSVGGAIPEAINTAAKATAKAQELSPDVVGLSAEVTRACRCLPASTYSACQNSLPSCSDELRIAMVINTSASFMTVVQFPGIPNETTLNRQAVIRVQ